LRSYFQKCVLDFSEFAENESFHGLNHHIDLKNAKAFSLSVRNQFNELDIILCYGPTVKQDFCYWIIIGAWNNSKSAIRKCAKGISEEGDERKTECDKLMITYNVRYSFLSGYLKHYFLVLPDANN
jgi:hypothetical protein